VRTVHGITLQVATLGEAAGMLEASSITYAADLAASTDGDVDRAMAHGRQVLDDLLPDGVATTGHSWFWVVVDGGRVGQVWVGPPSDVDHDTLYIWDIEIAVESRGRGYGAATIGAIIEEARRRSLTRVRLNVFAENAHARRLYERLGFVAVRDTNASTTLECLVSSD
jgi:ribosomal protein S18 acetylase RimI-like enzyme